jgi:hypothetical protein
MIEFHGICSSLSNTGIPDQLQGFSPESIINLVHDFPTLAGLLIAESII